MNEPYANGQIIRYIVNSKDRMNPVPGHAATPVAAAPPLGSPNNFQVQFRQPINIRADELWVKLSNFVASATPQGITKSPAPTGIKHGFDTKAYIDLCIDFGGAPLTQDTEQGIAEKNSSDRSFAHIPTARMENENCTRLYYDYDWVKVRNPGGLNTLGVKLFADTGLYLAAKNFTNTSSTVQTAVAITQVNGQSLPYTSSNPVTQLVLNFATAPGVIARGNEVCRQANQSASDLMAFIFGQATVLSTSGSTVTIGFQSQVMPTIPSGATFTYNGGSGVSQEPMDEWSMELLVTTNNPKNHNRAI